MEFMCVGARSRLAAAVWYALRALLLFTVMPSCPRSLLDWSRRPPLLLTKKGVLGLRSFENIGRIFM